MGGQGTWEKILSPKVGRKLVQPKLVWSSSRPAMGRKIRRDFYKFVHSKRGIRNSIRPWLEEIGHPKNSHVDKAEIFNVFFTSAFNNDGPWEVWSSVGKL